MMAALLTAFVFIQYEASVLWWWGWIVIVGSMVFRSMEKKTDFTPVKRSRS